MILATESEMTPVKKGRNQKGELNNHYNHPHTPEAKSKIATTQRARYDLLRKLASDEHIKRVVKEEIQKYLRANAAPLENKPTNNIPL